MRKAVQTPKLELSHGSATRYYDAYVKRIPSLDGLRAISISLVVVGHLAYAGRAPQFLSEYANLGVRIFS